MIKRVNVRIAAAVLSTVLAVSMAGCSGTKSGDIKEQTTDIAENSQVYSTVEEDTVSKQDTQKTVMEGFNALAEKGNALKEAIDYIDANIAGVSPENADIMVNKLEELQKKNLPLLEAKYSTDDMAKKISQIYKPDLDESTVTDESLKTLLLETKETGYRVETAEGFYFPIINYSFYKKYSPAVTDGLREYIEIMSIESDKVPAKDAALMIDWDEVLKRAFRQEAFLKNFPDSSKANDIRQLFKKYVTFTLYGLNNTPLFAYDTKTMVPEAKTAFEAAANKADSKLSSVLKDYLGVISKNGYKLTDEIEKYRKNAEGTF